MQRNFRIRLINPHSFSVNRRKDDFMQLNECFVALSKPRLPSKPFEKLIPHKCLSVLMAVGSFHMRYGGISGNALLEAYIINNDYINFRKCSHSH